MNILRINGLNRLDPFLSQSKCNARESPSVSSKQQPDEYEQLILMD